MSDYKKKSPYRGLATSLSSSVIYYSQKRKNELNSHIYPQGYKIFILGGILFC